MFIPAIAFVLVGFIEYTVQTTGPRTVVQGTARLHFNEDHYTDCLQHTFEPIKGRLGGPVLSCQPGQPMLPFDTVTHIDGQVTVEWCRTVGITVIQSVPCETPAHFSFYVIKDSYTPEDLSELLSAWGEIDSVWDLNLDGTVDGSDLVYAIGNWASE